MIGCWRKQHLRWFLFRADLTKFNGALTPQTRKKDQIWIAHSTEPASDRRSAGGYAADPILNQLFNWTITISSNATIHKKFIDVYKKKDNYLSWTPGKDFLVHANRSKDFCWIITNCDGAYFNRRNNLTQSLIESLTSKVHIWGRAIRSGCVDGKRPNIVDHGSAGDEGNLRQYEVPQTLTQDCKFTFAFENSNCSDFMTTRFINSLASGAIPIVMGQRDMYNDLLPGSFILADDFSSMTQLAKYLESLVQDEAKWNKYQEWRKFYTYEHTTAKAACELCHKLERTKSAQLKGYSSNPDIIPNMAEKLKSLQKCTPIGTFPL